MVLPFASTRAAPSDCRLPAAPCIELLLLLLQSGLLS